MKTKALLAIAIPILLLCSCGKKDTAGSDLLFDNSCQPQAILHDGKYYFIKQDDLSARITLWCAADIRDIPNGVKKTVWVPKDSAALKNIWSPEIHRIGNCWYIYYEADDGNTDNHHINVLANPSPDPMKGEFTHKGTLMTNPEWNYGLHPSVFFAKGRQYLIWSGWPKRRSEEETQCIYIASMKNPWTVESGRVMISAPEYEWERQWVNPDGTRSSYPIYVNENPEAFLSKDGKHIIIYYTASGNWTFFNAIGMLYASVGSNLLDPKSWHKHPEPVFMSNREKGIYAPCDISIVPAKDGNGTWLLYESKSKNSSGYAKNIRIKRITYDEKGFPVFGKPGEAEF